MVLCVKKLIRKKFYKTNTRFEFLDPDYPSVNPYKKKSFCKKSGPLCKKKWSEKNFKKLTQDSCSSTSITHWPSFMNNISLYFYAILRPISEVRTYKQSIRQFFFLWLFSTRKRIINWIDWITSLSSLFRLAFLSSCKINNVNSNIAYKTQVKKSDL